LFERAKIATPSAGFTKKNSETAKEPDEMEKRRMKYRRRTPSTYG
jgi:hypothetical protein